MITHRKHLYYERPHNIISRESQPVISPLDVIKPSKIRDIFIGFHIYVQHSHSIQPTVVGTVY